MYLKITTNFICFQFHDESANPFFQKEPPVIIGFGKKTVCNDPALGITTIVILLVLISLLFIIFLLLLLLLLLLSSLLSYLFIESYTQVSMSLKHVSAMNPCSQEQGNLSTSGNYQGLSFSDPTGDAANIIDSLWSTSLSQSVSQQPSDIGVGLTEPTTKDKLPLIYEVSYDLCT